MDIRVELQNILELENELCSLRKYKKELEELKSIENIDLKEDERVDERINSQVHICV